MDLILKGSAANLSVIFALTFCRIIKQRGAHEKSKFKSSVRWGVPVDLPLDTDLISYLQQVSTSIEDTLQRGNLQMVVILAENDRGSVKGNMIEQWTILLELDSTAQREIVLAETLRNIDDVSKSQAVLDSEKVGVHMQITDVIPRPKSAVPNSAVYFSYKVSVNIGSCRNIKPGSNVMLFLNVGGDLEENEIELFRVQPKSSLRKIIESSNYLDFVAGLRLSHNGDTGVAVFVEDVQINDLNRGVMFNFPVSLWIGQANFGSSKQPKTPLKRHSHPGMIMMDDVEESGVRTRPPSTANSKRLILPGFIENVTPIAPITRRIESWCKAIGGRFTHLELSRTRTIAFAEVDPEIEGRARLLQFYVRKALEPTEAVVSLQVLKHAVQVLSAHFKQTVARIPEEIIAHARLQESQRQKAAVAIQTRVRMLWFPNGHLFALQKTAAAVIATALKRCVARIPAEILEHAEMVSRQRTLKVALNALSAFMLRRLALDGSEYLRSRAIHRIVSATQRCLYRSKYVRSSAAQVIRSLLEMRLARSLFIRNQATLYLQSLARTSLARTKFIMLRAPSTIQAVARRRLIHLAVGMELLHRRAMVIISAQIKRRYAKLRPMFQRNLTLLILETQNVRVKSYLAHNFALKCGWSTLPKVDPCLVLKRSWKRSALKKTKFELAHLILAHISRKYCLEYYSEFVVNARLLAASLDRAFSSFFYNEFASAARFLASMLTASIRRRRFAQLLNDRQNAACTITACMRRPKRRARFFNYLMNRLRLEVHAGLTIRAFITRHAMLARLHRLTAAGDFLATRGTALAPRRKLVTQLRLCKVLTAAARRCLVRRCLINHVTAANHLRNIVRKAFVLGCFALKTTAVDPPELPFRVFHALFRRISAQRSYNAAVFFSIRMRAIQEAVEAEARAEEERMRIRAEEKKSRAEQMRVTERDGAVKSVVKVILMNVMDTVGEIEHNKMVALTRLRLQQEAEEKALRAETEKQRREIEEHYRKVMEEEERRFQQEREIAKREMEANAASLISHAVFAALCRRRLVGHYVLVRVLKAFYHRLRCMSQHSTASETASRLLTAATELAVSIRVASLNARIKSTAGFGETFIAKEWVLLLRPKRSATRIQAYLRQVLARRALSSVTLLPHFQRSNARIHYLGWKTAARYLTLCLSGKADRSLFLSIVNTRMYDRLRATSAPNPFRRTMSTEGNAIPPAFSPAALFVPSPKAPSILKPRPPSAPVRIDPAAVVNPRVAAANLRKRKEVTSAGSDGTVNFKSTVTEEDVLSAEIESKVLLHLAGSIFKDSKDMAQWMTRRNLQWGFSWTAQVFSNEPNLQRSNPKFFLPKPPPPRSTIGAPSHSRTFVPNQPVARLDAIEESAWKLRSSPLFENPAPSRSRKKR